MSPVVASSQKLLCPRLSLCVPDCPPRTRHPPAKNAVSPPTRDAVSPLPPDAVSPLPPDAASPLPPDAVSPPPRDAVSPPPPDAVSPLPKVTCGLGILRRWTPCERPVWHCGTSLVRLTV